MTLAGPGCGKTHRALELMTAELERGTPPERIAFVTFTRAARKEAMDRVCSRFAFSPRKFCWLRTVHSAAYRLLNLGHYQILNDDRWSEFAKRHHYDLDVHGYQLEDEPLELYVPSRRSRDDLMLYVLEWGRNRLLTPGRALARCPVEGVSASQYRLFVERLDAFKAEHGLLDFPDLLEDVLAGELRPDVDVAFVDEAHDLSPLQIAVVESWFAPCERSYVFADDDQAIFNFQGADPTWIRGLAERCETEVLTRSHRVPVAVHALAERIIGGNRDRLPKTYEPCDRLGQVLVKDWDQAIEMVDGSRSTFVLCRNRRFLRPIAAVLLGRAVPFVVEGWGGRSPLSHGDLVAAVRLGQRLAGEDEGPFSTGYLESLLSFVSSGTGLIPRGVKERVRERRGEGSFSREELVEKLGLGALLEAIGRDGPLSVLAKLTDGDRRYLQALLDRYGELPSPQVRLTSMHAGKGREAELIVVVPDMGRATYRDYTSGQKGHEAENRVYYVAVTRAQDTLVLVQPRTRRHYRFPRVEITEGVV